MPKYKANLSTVSVDKLIANVSAYRDKLKDLAPKLVEKAVESGVEEAKDQALYMNAYDTGELVGGIVGEVDGSKGYIVSTAPHSKFVEFGTGIMGKQSPYPVQPPVGWHYDVNEHGEAGWWYPGKDGKYHWTKGMPSRPYMYDTAQAIRQSLPYIADGILDDE